MQCMLYKALFINQKSETIIQTKLKLLKGKNNFYLLEKLQQKDHF